MVRRRAPEAVAKPTRLPSAEELGTRTAAAIRKAGGWSGRALASLVSSCRLWGAEARRGFKDLIDLESLRLQGPDRPRALPARREPAPRPSTPASEMSPTRVPGGVTVVERSQSRGTVLEVSVLESLGFYDPTSQIVVSVETPAPPGPAGTAAPLPRQAPEPGVTSRQLIPDLDLGSWKPHVIARSKLGRQRLSAATIVVVSLTLLGALALVASLFRAPGDRAILEEEAVTQTSSGLATALTGLDPILADATTDVAEATSLLISVDTAARALFDAAASLGDGAEQQVVRQSASSVAQRALQLESLVGEALSYRLVLNPLWRSPALAGVTDPTQAAAAISAWETQLVDMSVILPAAAELSPHVEQVRAFVDGIEAWRTRYLDALAVDDSAGAEAAVADLEGQLALLAQAGEETLTTVFDDADNERTRILADLAILTG
ncbi:MAG TPA: hypothetical protein VLA54_14110 [Acidimicrobiia bacterium]|nr:hypothetical protein [Acidimicrobiia bacterium]